MAIVTIKGSELEVSVKTLGAQLDSVKDNSGKEYMWCGDPKIWGDKSPNLFPIASFLEGNKYTFNGKEYSMKPHGFAQDMEFEVESKSEDSVTFLLKSNDVSRAQYPFEFEFRIKYKVSGRKLIVDFKTDNKTDGNMYYSTGAHEGFAISGDVSNYSIVLDEEETLRRYECLEGIGVSEITLPCFENSKELKLRDDYFTQDAIIFFEMKSRGLALRDDRDGSTIHVAFPGFDTLLIWKHVGAGFVCIEPWAGAPDLPWKRVDDFSKKYRIRTLKKGESETLTHTVTF